MKWLNLKITRMFNVQQAKNSVQVWTWWTVLNFLCPLYCYEVTFFLFKASNVPISTNRSEINRKIDIPYSKHAAASQSGTIKFVKKLKAKPKEHPFLGDFTNEIAPNHCRTKKGFPSISHLSISGLGGTLCGASFHWMDLSILRSINLCFKLRFTCLLRWELASYCLLSCGRTR